VVDGCFTLAGSPYSGIAFGGSARSPLIGWLYRAGTRIGEIPELYGGGGLPWYRYADLDYDENDSTDSYLLHGEGITGYLVFVRDGVVLSIDLIDEGTSIERIGLEADGQMRLHSRERRHCSNGIWSDSQSCQKSGKPSALISDLSTSIGSRRGYCRCMVGFNETGQISDLTVRGPYFDIADPRL
jgi:hypothetical protein